MSMEEFLAILLGIFMLGYGMYHCFENYKLAKNGESALGTVVGLEPSRRFSGHYYPVIVFRPRKGKQVKFKYLSSFNIWSVPKLNQLVMVRYNPNDPRKATIDSFGAMWGPPIMVCLFGIAILALGIIG